ncbi:hypothetical protein [Geomicrobium sediminis]|uniref:Uncharacterized protein n=1 Tax=Geomicrobium sediminis TaxID=1347788 RepID=A0ABS2PFM4_9BACL|nr:hypothetical protein [Geomicrobium sediminis]EZH64334.1 hypothetical protein DH09_01060 [Bacillaceae bacterium JMAK1]MBM7634233.1 hypothetical protein [Geomicrobium sediminis]
MDSKVKNIQLSERELLMLCKILTDTASNQLIKMKLGKTMDYDYKTLGPMLVKIGKQLQINESWNDLESINYQ